MANCCIEDAECNDGITCTEDRCVSNDCLHVAFDDRCGARVECAVPVCRPSDPAGGASGCVLQAADEATYCGEDADPCTIDACRTGTCEHEEDGSGDRCPMLEKPFGNAITLLTDAGELRAAVTSALATGCSDNPECAQNPAQARLLTLLDSAQTDLQAAILALGGRLAGPPSPAVSRDPIMRGRLALALLSSTPGDLRGFLATLAQMKGQHQVEAAFARARRREGQRLLRGTRKLRTQLRQATRTRGSFTR
jgi:hypothetical protein